MSDVPTFAPRNRTPDEALKDTLNADAPRDFGILVREANEQLSQRAWQVWYFILFKFQGSNRELLEFGRAELKRVKKWQERGFKSYDSARRNQPK